MPVNTYQSHTAVAILKKDNWIRKHRGKSSGYRIHPTDSSTIKKNRADVKVTLHGKKGSVYVHYLMELTTEGEWGVKEIFTKEVPVSSCTPTPEEPTDQVTNSQ